MITGPHTAKLMLVLLAVAWGVNWPLMRIALQSYPPFSLRLHSMLLGAATIYLIARLRGRSLRIPSGRARLHLLVTGTLIMALCGIFSSIAQMEAATTRVVILVYTMPIWVSLLAVPVLHERIDRPRQIALALCAGGLAILTYPLMREGNMTGAVLAVLSAASLAAGTVYMKWSAVDADRLAHVFWQLIVGAALVAATLPIFEGAVHIWPAPPTAVLSLLYAGIVGFGFGFALWFGAIDRISVSTAALGILSVPLTGVTSSVIILGERPTATDLAGFVLIFAASACVLLAPSPAPRSQPTGG